MIVWFPGCSWVALYPYSSGVRKNDSTCVRWIGRLCFSGFCAGWAEALFCRCAQSLASELNAWR